MSDVTPGSTSTGDEYKALTLAALLYTRAAGLAKECLEQGEEANIGEIFNRALGELNCSREELVSLWDMLLAGSQAASQSARRSLSPMNQGSPPFRVPVVPENTPLPDDQITAYF